MIERKEEGVEKVIGKKRKIGTLVLIFLGIVLIGILARPFAQHIYEGEVDVKPEKMALYCGETLVDDDVKDITGYRLKEGEEYRLTGTVSFDGKKADAPYLFLTINHDWFRVELDGEEIFSYMEDDVDTDLRSSSPGNSYVPVPLGKDCMGKTLDICFYPALDAGAECDLPIVRYGDYASTARSYYKEDLLTNAITITFMVLGMLLLVFSFSLPASGENSRLWHLGMFSVLLAVYNYTESLFNVTVMSNPYMAYLINFMFFAAVPIPLLMFYRHSSRGGYRKGFTAVIWLGAADIAVQTLLHFTGVMDFREMVTATHLFYGIAFLYAFVAVIKMEDGRKRKELILGLVCIMAGLILDAASFYSGMHLLRGNTPYMKMGIILMVIIEIRYLAGDITKLYRENVMAEIYRKRAMKDEMTGLGSRNAFNSEIEAIKKGGKDNGSLVCAVMDLNGLKVINDVKGHRAGDLYIKTAAEELSIYMGRHGSIFRTGGDEFTAFIYDMDREAFSRDMKELRQRLHDRGIEYAAGYSSCRGKTIEACLEEADQRMYANKRKSKKQIKIY